MSTPNRILEAAWRYHHGTKHSHQSVRTNPHFLDWSNRPRPFKLYPALDPLPLPRDLPQTNVPALAALAPGAVPAGDVVPELSTLAHILYFSAGITRRKTYPVGEVLFRAASCTGALYEIELYLVCGDLPGLAAGVYHFDPGDFALRQLRRGDYRGALVHATAAEPAVASAPALVICTGIYWRNAWKYQARTYRHFGWDNGTLLANLLAAGAAWNLPAKLVCGFVDSEVNHLLGLDTEREVAFSMVALGRVANPPPEPPANLPPLNLETVPYSPREADYPGMREMHAASCLHSPQEVAAWHGPAPVSDPPVATGKVIPLQVPAQEQLPRDPLESVVLRRGSSRKFAQEAISFAQLSTLLHCASRGLPADFLEPPGTRLNQWYLIVHAVNDLPSGLYRFHPERSALELLREGSFRSEAYALGLEQELPADASVAIFFLADLPGILERFGNRGYRATQLEAGLLGGKLYLAAYAQRLGATGLTFYDDDVVQFFAPHADGMSTIFLMAAGKSAKSRLVGLR
ncbi:MAG: SagB/ThcOx family dehydrogenase [Candidatus Acidoferrales bacterium]